MNRKVISPVVLEWSSDLLTVHWSERYLYIAVVKSVLLVPVIWGLLHHQNSYFWVISCGLIASFCSSGVLELTSFHEAVLLDRKTNCVRLLRTDGAVFGFPKKVELGAFETITAGVGRLKNITNIVELRDESGKAFMPFILKLFKKKEQAQEVADILNAFLHQPAMTETPGVWPPPPRMPSAPTREDEARP